MPPWTFGPTVREREEQPQSHWNGGLYFSDRPIGGTFRHISSVNCPSAMEQPHGKVMLAGWRSKTVAFIAILALLTFGALATASAFPSRPDEKEAKAEDVTPAAAQALHSRGLAAWREGKYSEAEGLYKRALAIREKALGANHPDVA